MTKAYYGMSLTTAEHFELDFKSLDITCKEVDQRNHTKSGKLPASGSDDVTCHIYLFTLESNNLL